MILIIILQLMSTIMTSCYVCSLRVLTVSHNCSVVTSRRWLDGMATFARSINLLDQHIWTGVLMANQRQALFWRNASLACLVQEALRFVTRHEECIRACRFTTEISSDLWGPYKKSTLQHHENHRNKDLNYVSDQPVHFQFVPNVAIGSCQFMYCCSPNINSIHSCHSVCAEQPAPQIHVKTEVHVWKSAAFPTNVCPNSYTDTDCETRLGENNCALKISVTVV